ncbi:MAG: VWA domain-containing protein [Candidatus Omnitrophica bacterium]|nr:VWA domain-containing protein [Candidatus Omnitrophota bacterium]
MKKHNYFLLAVSISLIIHILLLLLSGLIWIPGLSQTIQDTAKMFELKAFHLAAPPQMAAAISAERLKQLKFERPGDGTESLLKSKLVQDVSIKTPEELHRLIQEETTLEQAAETSPDDSQLSQRLKERVTVEKKILENPPEETNLEIFESPEDWLYEYQTKQIPEAFSEQMPAYTPERITPTMAQGSLDSLKDRLNPVLQSGFTPSSPHASLEGFLAGQVRTYWDSAENQGYYQISLYPLQKAENLDVMPKEIIFLVDASLSIKDRRLYAFKEGIKYALEHLNPQDRFNIYVFKNEIIPFSQSLLPADSRIVQNAMNFLDGLESSNTTNIYSAFLETIQKPAERHPSYIMLISDGKPTRSMASTNLIEKITHTNNAERAIFAFSGGARVNRFLLDFLAYPNRGWSEYARLNAEIKPRLMEFYDKIKNPVLMNVHYQVTPLNESDIYPKHSTDIYQNTVFTIFGKYKKESPFSIRILGNDSEGKTREMIFSADLQNAERGTDEIARFWAFNKIYELISEMILNGATADRKRQVSDLVEKFDLQIPYNLDRL